MVSNECSDEVVILASLELHRVRLGRVGSEGDRNWRSTWLSLLLIADSYDSRAAPSESTRFVLLLRNLLRNSVLWVSDCARSKVRI